MTWPSDYVLVKHTKELSNLSLRLAERAHCLKKLAAVGLLHCTVDFGEFGKDWESFANDFFNEAETVLHTNPTSIAASELVQVVRAQLEEINEHIRVWEYLWNLRDKIEQAAEDDRYEAARIKQLEADLRKLRGK